MSTYINPSTNQTPSLCARGINSCAFSPVNKKVMQVMLLVIGLFFLGMGIYGAVIAPQMWGSYVVIGLGIASLVVDAALLISKAIASAELACSQRRVPGENQIVSEHVTPSPQPSPTQTPRPITSAPKPPKASFNIGHLFEYHSLWSLPEFKGLDFRAEAPTSVSCPDFILDVFEQKNAPVLRGVDKNGNLCVIMRFSVYSSGGEHVEDNVIQFLQQPKDNWMCFSYLLSKTDDPFLLAPQCGPTSPQKTWLKSLIDETEVSLPSFLMGCKESLSSKYVCKLWNPEEKKEKPYIERLFGVKEYPKRDLPTLNSGNMFMYQNLPAVARGLFPHAIWQGALQSGESYYLVHFSCRSTGRLIGFGHLFFWNDKGRWRLSLNANNPLFQPKLSSEFLDELSEEEVELLEKITTGKEVELGEYVFKQGHVVSF